MLKSIKYTTLDSNYIPPLSLNGILDSSEAI